MNIFLLDSDIQKAAQSHCDRHIVKMPTEAVQLLCSVHLHQGNYAPMMCGTAHLKHPCAIWVRESRENYMWLLEFAQALLDEYTKRYGKFHKTQIALDWCKANIPNLPSVGLTPFALAMPEECKGNNPIDAYRKYYIDYKWDSKVFYYRKGTIPEWLAEGLKSSAHKSLGKSKKKAY